MKDYMKIIISILLMMIPTLIFGFLGLITQMAIALFAGFASAVLLNIDKFESFTAWKLQAKMRETTKVIDDANATIEQLKSVTEPLLKSNLILLLYDGSFDGMGIEDKEATFFELLKVNEALKLESVTTHIKKAAISVTNHHFHELYRCADKTFREIYNKYTTIDFAPETPTIKEVEQFFKKHPGAMTREVKEKLDKFTFFKKRFLEY